MQVFLGFTRCNEVVFANVNNIGTFSVSFDASYPVVMTDDVILNIIENLIDSSDKEWILDKLETYDCKPSELPREIMNDTYDPIEEFFDNSLYSEFFSIDGVEDDIYFFASSCGQYDTRGKMSIYINKELYDYLHELWDEYHLKDIPLEKYNKLVEAIEHQNNTIDEYKIIENRLKSLVERGNLK